MKYQELENHFTLRKRDGNLPYFDKPKRVPRKFKKKFYYILNNDRYSFLSLGQKLWFIQGIENPNFNRFLIKQQLKK